MKNWVFGIVILLGFAGCRTQESKPFPNAPATKRLDGSMFTAAEIDGTVTRLMNVAKVTGAGIAILNDGKIVYLKTYGFRDLKKSRPLNPDSVMSAASFTKVVFAYMVMQLVQEGVLDLDKPFYQYLPKPLPEYGRYTDLAGDERYKKITARMLLDHTSGFPSWRFEQDQANGYDEQENSLGPQRRLRADSAGSMLTTPADFALFMQAVMQGHGLRKEIKDLMLSPQIQILSKHGFPRSQQK